MASGSTAPFSGEFNDLENVPTLPEGISAEQILEQNADAIRQAAESRHAAGLSQVEADGGFFDAYVDNSQVFSTSGSALVLTGANGKATIQDSSNFNPTESTSTNTISKAQGFEINPNKEVNKIQATLDGNSVGVSRVGVCDSSGAILKSKTGNFTSGDTIILNDLSLSVGNNFYVFADNQGNAFTFTFGGQSSDINGTVADYEGGANGVLSGNPNVDRGIRMFTSFKVFSNGKNGTLTQKEFTFTDTQGNAFSPSKVGIFPDQTLNGQSISYDLKDSTGTLVKTFNQADLNQLQSVNTTDTTFQVQANFSGNGSQIPKLEFLDVRGV